MALSIRLTLETKTKLENMARVENKTKSEIIREALELYFKNFSEDKTPFELGKEYFGKHGSGQGDLSINGEKILKEKIRRKFNAKKHS